MREYVSARIRDSCGRVLTQCLMLDTRFSIADADGLSNILCKFVGNLFIKDVFDGQGDYAFASLFEKGLYLVYRIG